MKIACLLVTHLPVKAEQRRRAGLRGRPVVVAESHGLRQVVLDCSPEALGVTVGMPLQEALSRHKAATLLQADGPYYRAVFDGIVELLALRSPVVEMAELGCVYVGVDGLEAMYGGEPRLAAALLEAMPRDFNARLGLAGGKFPAYVAAAMSGGGSAKRVPDDVAGFLARLPVDLLPISWEKRARLHRFGLHTMGRLASETVGAVQAQFGPEGKQAWELANGIDPRPLVAHVWEEEVSEFLVFPAPATTLFTVVPAVEILLGRAFASPALRGKYVRLAAMESSVMNKPMWQKRVAFKSAVNGKEKALPVLKSSLEATELPGVLEDMRLTLSGITGESGVQFSLFSDVRRQEQLREMMKQLEARLGGRPPIYQVRDVEPWSRVPERRQALVSYEP